MNDGGKCKPPAGKFGCGSHFCAIGLDYCEVVGSDVFGQPSSYACKPLPPLCEAPPSCACLSNVTCGDMCTEAPGGGIEVVCPGG